MLHIDIPTRAQIDRLLENTHPSSVSIYVRTDPASHGDAERIECRTLTARAVEQLRAGDRPKDEIAAIEEQLHDLADDEEFWRYQARSLAVFVTPDGSTLYRLPNRIDSSVEVADRFFVKPLLRVLTVPQAAYVLALAQNSWRLLAVTADAPPADVTPADAPADVAEAAGVPTIRDRAPRGKIQGSEGQKVRMRQYAMQVDRAIRPLLTGSSMPLILAAAEPLASIYRQVNSHPMLAPSVIGGNPETTPDSALSDQARPILDELHAAELARLHERFDAHRGDRRSITDLADVARAATLGLVDTVFVCIEEPAHGTVDEAGSIQYADGPGPDAYGIVDEVARRSWSHGGRVLAVRGDEVPGGGPVAAILRYLP